MKNRIFHRICTVLYNNTLRLHYNQIVNRLLKIRTINKTYSNVKTRLGKERIDSIICDECMAFLHDFGNDDWKDTDDHFYIIKDNSLSNIVSIKNEWHAIFNDVCYGIGFSDKNTNMLWTELVNGNWKHLQKSNKEEENTPADWFDSFCRDVFYCSDRWSLDRLMRCHWLHRQWLISEWENCKDADYDSLHWYIP